MTEVVSVVVGEGVRGPAGPTGPTGAAGPQGPAGAQVPGGTADHSQPYVLSGALNWKPIEVFYAREFGVKADGITRTDGIINGNQLSFAGAAFQAGDVGKLAVVVAAGTALTGTLSSGLTSGTPVASVPVNALAQAIPPGGLTLDDGAGHTQTFITAGAPAGATSIPVAPPQFTKLTSALSTGGPITSLPVSRLPIGNADGTHASALVTVISPDMAHSQTFTASSAQAVGAVAIPVTSQTPNFAFPVGSLVCYNYYWVPNQLTPNFSYPAGTTVRTPIPALSTMIQSVSGGVATLAAPAGTNIASNAEVFYATDDTVDAQAALTAAGAVNGTVEFPYGQIGLSAALVSAQPVAIRGQGVMELYGSSSGGALPALAFPTVAPYLTGTVFVQCTPNADGIQLNAVGQSQHIEKFGVRFAGRFQNTGHGINSSGQPVVGTVFDTGISGGRASDIVVFGHDGNHYGFNWQNNIYGRHDFLRWHGGGGYNFQQLIGAGSVGNLTADRLFGMTLVGGVAHAWAMQNVSGGTIDWCQLVNIQPYLYGPTNQPFTNLVSPAAASTGSCNQYQIMGQGPCNQIGFIGPDLETNGVSQEMLWPSVGGATSGFGGQGTYVTGMTPRISGSQNPSLPNPPTTASVYQNATGMPQLCEMVLRSDPLASAAATSTLNGATTAGARTMTLTSAAGFAAGQAVQIDTGSVLEYAIIQSIASNTLTFDHTLKYAHANGVTVTSGAAVLFGVTTQSNLSNLSGNVNLGNPQFGTARPIGSPQGEVQTLYFVIGSGLNMRLDFANVTPMYAIYTSIVQ